MNLHEIIQDASEELYRRSRLSEQLENLKREAIRASKQAVLYIHRREMKRALGRLRKAKALISKASELGKDRPDLIYTSSYEVALQEYAEARLLMGFIRFGKYPHWKEIGVPPVPYVMALGDLVGELRRSALDSLKDGDIKKAEEFLKAMEDLYLELFSIDEPRALSGELRHKVDTARRLLETTRGELAIEFRRKSLESSIKSLEETLKRYEAKPWERKGEGEGESDSEGKGGPKSEGGGEGKAS